MQGASRSMCLTEDTLSLFLRIMCPTSGMPRVDNQWVQEYDGHS